MREKTKVLVLRFSSIGDVVLTTPVLRCLKKIPGKEFEIHYATKKKFAGILKNNPHIHKIHTLDGKLSLLMRELKKENFDYIIDLHKNLRTALVKLKLRKKSFTFPKINLQKWLAVNLKKNMLPNVHIVDRYIFAANALGIKNDNLGLEYYFLPEVKNIKLDEYKNIFQSGYIGFVIGGMHSTKKLPNEKIASIIEKLNYPVILFGGKEDEENGDEVVKILNSKNVFNACGKHSLDESAFLVSNAKVIITHDTGLMHIAAAFYKPIVSVWGNTIPEFGMYPYMPGYENHSFISEVEGLKCRPCSKIGHKKCPKKHFKCMMEIDEEMIIDFCKTHIDKASDQMILS